MNPTLFNLIIGAVTIVATITTCSFIEYVVHGPLMHGKWAPTKLRRDHIDHHGHYHGKTYKNHDHGDHVFLPWWAGVATIVPMGGIGAGIGYLANNGMIFYLVTATTALHYCAYQYVHTCMHVPTGRWFEGTRLFRWLDEYHQAHHAPGISYERPVHVCLLCPIADFIIAMFRKRQRLKG